MNYEFHPDALAEFEAAADFYQARQPELEIRFLDAVHSVLRQIGEAPERWRFFDREIRRALVHVFPFAVLYSVERDRIYVIAVMHCSRQPGYWKDRTK